MREWGETLSDGMSRCKRNGGEEGELHPGFAVVLNTGDDGSLSFPADLACQEQPQIWLPDASFGSPVVSPSHTGPSEGQSGGATALKQERMCPSPSESFPCCFFSVQELFLNIIKM